MKPESTVRLWMLRAAALGSLWFGIQSIRAQAPMKEYVWMGGKLVAIDSVAKPQIFGYKIDPYGLPFRAPGATITIDSVLSYGPEMVRFGPSVTAGSHALVSSTPAGYTAYHCASGSCSWPGSYTATNSANVTAPANGAVDSIWLYTSNITPSANYTSPHGVSTAATSGSYDVSIFGAQNTDGVFLFVSPNPGLVPPYAAVELTDRWKATVPLANHPQYAITFVEAYLYGTKQGGGTLQDNGATYFPYRPVIQAANAGFDLGNLNGWQLYDLNSPTPQGSVTLNAARTGTHGFSANSGNMGGFQDVDGLLPGNVYTVKAWVRSSAASGGPNAHILLNDTVDVNNNSGTGEVATTNGWQQISLNFTATYTCRLRIHLHRESGGTGSVYWDDVTVTSAALLNPGFESGSGSWNTYTSAGGVTFGGSVMNAERLTGTSSYALQSGHGGIFQDVVGLPGAGYRFEGWAKSSNPDAGVMTKMIVLDPATGQGNATADSTLGSEWQRFCVPITAPASGTMRVYAVRVNNPQAMIYWDDLVVRSGTSCAI